MNAREQFSGAGNGTEDRAVTPVRIAVAVAIGAALLVAVFANHKPESGAAGSPATRPHIVGRAQAAAPPDAPGSGMPAPSATATEGNVADMTF